MAYTPTVLVIDDLPETGRMIAKYMSRSGISLVSACTGEEGLDIVRSRAIDAILLDIDLGSDGCDGLDVLVTLKKDQNLKHIPVVMLSVFDNPDTKVRAFRLGAEDYITKPFEPVVLRARIETVLRGVQSWRALKRSREKYHSLFRNSLVGIFRTSLKDSRLLTCNDKALELLGLGREHIKVVRLLEFYANSEDRRVLVERLQQNGAIHNYELEMRRLDGSAVWLSLSAQMFPDEGYMEGVATDITERVHIRRKIREKEEQFRVTFNQAAVGIMHVSTGWQLLRANQKICDILGYTTEELLDMNIPTITHPADLEFSSLCLRKLLGHEVENCATEERYQRRDGSYVWVQSTVSLVSDDESGAKYLIVVVEDIEKRKQAEHMLKQIVEAVSPKIGDSFFTSLVTHLATSLDVDYAYIGEYLADQNELLVKASSAEADIPKDWIFPLSGTPAEEVLRSGMMCCEQGVRSLFSDVPIFDVLMPEGYIGMALYDAHGRPLGLISIISRKPLSATAEKAALLKVVAARAANELERKRSELALKKSEANLKALFDNALQAFLLIDSRGAIRAMNKTAAAISQRLWQRDVVEGSELREFIRPDALPAFIKHFAFAISGRPTDMEWQVEAPDGICYWFEFSFTPVFIDGCVTGVCMSILDITNRRLAVEQLAKSEERFRTLIERSTDMIVLINSDGVVQYHSPSVSSVLGYHSQEMIGRNEFDFIHPDDVHVLRSNIAAITEQPGGVITITLRRRHHDGKWHYLESTVTNLLHDPNLHGFIINSNDITERVMSENERTSLLSALEAKNNELQQAIDVLQETQAQLVQSERASAVGNLVAGVMHEINNPNAAIYGAIQDALQTVDAASEYFLSLLAEEDRASAEASRMMSLLSRLERTTAIAADGAERIRAIVATLRSFTKHQEAEHQTAGLEEQIASTVTLFHYQFKNVEVRQHFSTDGEPLLISGNLGEINQVFLNLLVNAAQAEATVIEISAQWNEKGELQVVITDNGMGMDETTQMRIFDPFFTTRGVGNTGLGLNISRKIMLKHNASITVESKPGSGATFTLVFPAEQQEIVSSGVAA